LCLKAGNAAPFWKVMLCTAECADSKSHGREMGLGTHPRSLVFALVLSLDRGTGTTLAILRALASGHPLPLLTYRCLHHLRS